MAPEFTGAKEPDELPEVDTASDAYPVLEERKKDRKKERMSVHVHLRSLLFSRNEMSSRKSVTRENDASLTLEIRSDIRVERALLHLIYRRAITIHAPLVPASRCWCSRRLFSSVPLDVAFAVKPFFKHSAGTPIDADECERVAHNARFANNDAKCFRDIASSTFSSRLFPRDRATRFVYARRKVKTDRFYSFSTFFFSFFLLRKKSERNYSHFSNLKRRRRRR